MTTTLPDSAVPASAASMPSQQASECDTSRPSSFNPAIDGSRGPNLQKVPLSLAAKGVTGSPPVQDLLALSTMAANSPPQKDVPTSSSSGQSTPLRIQPHIKAEVDTSPLVQSMPFSFMGSLGMGAGGMAAGKAASSSTAAPPSFLTKTFDIVEDPSSNAIISWGMANNSFVVWDPHAFSCELLPRFFRHNNFASFVRQLNTYGFRKVEPDRWEYANGCFLRGQRHLLKGIERRRTVSTFQQQQSTGAGNLFVGFDKIGVVQNKIEELRRERKVLMCEVVRLRQQEQSIEQEIAILSKRLESSVQVQQQLMLLFSERGWNPLLMAQLMQKYEQAKGPVLARKRRPPSGGLSNVHHVVPTNLDGEFEILLEEMEQNQFTEWGWGDINDAEQQRW